MNAADNVFVPHNVPRKELDFSCLLPFVFLGGWVTKTVWVTNTIMILYLISDILLLIALPFLINKFTTHGYSFMYYKKFPHLYIDWSAPLNIRYSLVFFLIEIPFLIFLLYAGYETLIYLLILNIYFDMMYIKVMKFSVSQMDEEFSRFERFVSK